MSALQRRLADSERQLSQARLSIEQVHSRVTCRNMRLSGSQANAALALDAYTLSCRAVTVQQMAAQ